MYQLALWKGDEMPSNDEKRGQEGPSPRQRLESAFPGAFSNLWHELSASAEEGVSVRVVCRGLYDWLAIARRFDGSGQPVVCFGNSESFFGALAALNASIGKGAWKADKFAK